MGVWGLSSAISPVERTQAPVQCSETLQLQLTNQIGSHIAGICPIDVAHHCLKHVLAGYILQVLGCYVDTGQMDKSQPGFVCGEVFGVDGPNQGFGAAVGRVLLERQYEGAELGA